jgi:hypothetical protein
MVSVSNPVLTPFRPLPNQASNLISAAPTSGKVSALLKSGFVIAVSTVLWDVWVVPAPPPVCYGSSWQLISAYRALPYILVQLFDFQDNITTLCGDCHFEKLLDAGF